MIKKNITIFLFLFVLLLFSSCAGLPGKAFDTFEKKINENYSIRVIGYQVKCFGICDADYVIESINNNSGYPNRILYEFKNNDPYDIPEENFIVKNDKLAYFWWSYIFGITTDGGKTWTVFNTLEDQEIRNSVSYINIDNVEINNNGVGKMHFKQYEGKKNKIDFLETKDFGKSWINLKPTEPKLPKNISPSNL